MGSVTVRTKEELKAAKDAKAQRILVVGKLASDFGKARKITALSGVALAAVGAAVGLAPVTGGFSTLGLVALAAGTGVEVAVIIAAATFGIALVLAIHKGYNVKRQADGSYEFTAKPSA